MIKALRDSPFDALAGILIFRAALISTPFFLLLTKYMSVLEVCTPCLLPIHACLRFRGVQITTHLCSPVVPHLVPVAS